MIKSKADLKFFLSCDAAARWGKTVGFIKKIKAGSYWKFNKTLRHQEFNINCRKGLVKRFLVFFYKIKMRRLSKRTGWYIPPNTFGPGLCIVHFGPVIVNKNSRFGCNCRVQAMVNIGSNSGSDKAPSGGDFIYFGPGCVLFGDISLGSNVAIGANAVVNKSFGSNVTIAGVPAKIVSQKGSNSFIFDAVSYIRDEKDGGM